VVRVLVAEDSVTTRELLIQILRADPDVEIVGEAKNGIEAIAMTKRLRPDVITMDIGMPRMDGFEATKQIMIENPTPIVIVSGSIDVREVVVSMHALRAGALAVLRKPVGPGAPTFDAECRELIETVKAMAGVKLVRHRPERSVAATPPLRTVVREGARHYRLVAMAASTGGPAALNRILSDLPREFPIPIVAVQHISLGFAGGLASWLDTTCALRVTVAEQGAPLAPGTIYLAPDGRHLGVSPAATLVLSDEPPIGGFRPSATFLFRSVAKTYGSSAVAVILTGMGQDGVEGLRTLRAAGGHVIAQDETSAVVFGMPGAAISAGLADSVLPVTSIADRLVRIANGSEEGPWSRY
jgi:two-component system chemotaxis response regulator CheB